MSITSEIRLRVRKEGDVVLNQLSAKLNDLASRSTLTTSKFNDLAATLKNTDNQIRTKSINNLQDYARAWRELANNVDITSKEFRQATQEAQRFEREAAKAQGRRTGGGRLAGIAQTTGAIAASGIFGGPEGFLGAGIGALAGGPAGAAVGGAIGAQVGMARQQISGTATYAAEISRQRQALQLVTKDVGEYQRALSFIDRTSRDLAIPQEILTRQFTQLTASVKGAGGNVRDAEKAFIGVASGIRGTGGSLEQLDSALTATSQVFSKGKVSAEELRQQIGERLPGAFSLFAESIGMTPQELDKALEKGQVSLQDFQKFSEKLFAEYGENAKIIADGPDAAGDRLKTAMSKLSESVGTLLKPIGAGFQDIFTKIINIIDKAVRKFNEFAKIVGQKDLQRLRTEATTQAQLITDLEKMGAKRAQKGSILEEQYTRALDKQKRIQAEIVRYELKAKPPGAAPEPSSKLPGIDLGTDKAPKAPKIPVQRIADLYARSELGLELSQKQLRIQQLVTKAKQQGNEYDAQLLPTIGAILQQNTKIAQAQQQVTDLIENKNVLLKQGMSMEEWTARYDNAKIKAQTEIVNRKTAYQKLQQQEAEIGKRINEEEIAARALIQKALTDAATQSMVLTEEDRKRLEINTFLADVIDKVYGKLTNEELLNAIRELRKGLQDAADAGKDFGSKLGKSFAEVVKASGELAQNLGASLGNAFLGLGDQLAEFVTTGKANFADFARSVLNDLSRILIQFAMFQTLKALVPSGSAFGKFLGFANGGIMTGNGALPLKRYAAGGIASSPQLAMFGEGSRPEAYVPLPDGRTIPVTMRGGGDMGNIVVNVDAGGTSVQGNQPDANKLGEALGIAVRQELIRQKRPGGLLA
jgi:lambda family phage tail tape measure protein